MKSIRTLPTILAVILFALPALSSEAPWYTKCPLTIKEKLYIYCNAASFIDHIIPIKTKTHLFYIAATEKNWSCTNKKQIIQTRFQQIEQQLRQAKKDAIKDLMNHYQITTEQYDHILSLTMQSKDYEKEYMSQPRTETRHDENFPQEIFPILEENGIHPKSINFIVSEKPSKYKHHACTQSLNASFMEEGNQLIIKKINHPPIITVYPIFFTFSPTRQKAILLHEAQHLIEQHSIINSWLVMGISKYTGLTYTEIRNNPLLKKITILCEQEAEIMSALKHQNAATTLRLNRTTDYYPNTLFISHYSQLAEIDELHKLNARLTNYKPMPVQRVDDLKVMEWSIDPTVLKS